MHKPALHVLHTDKKAGRKGLGRGVPCQELPHEPPFLAKKAPKLTNTNPAPNILQSRTIEGAVFVFKVLGCHHKV